MEVNNLKPNTSRNLDFFPPLCTVVFLFILLAFNPTRCFAGKRIAILPFKDDSGFQGKWNLKLEIPKLLGRVLSRDSLFQIIPHDSVFILFPKKGSTKDYNLERIIEYGQKLQADVVITGLIEDFDVSRFSLGDPSLAGYKSFSGSVKLKDVRLIRITDGKIISTLEAEKKMTDRDLGLDILGKPRKQDIEFYGLDKLEFGSSRFDKTIIGMVTNQALADLVEQIKSNLLLRPKIETKGRNAIILSVNGDTGYVDVGSDDNSDTGSRLNVFKSGTDSTETKVGTVEITEVMGAHLSKIRIVEGVGIIKPGQVVREQR